MEPLIKRYLDTVQKIRMTIFIRVLVLKLPYAFLVGAPESENISHF